MRETWQTVGGHPGRREVNVQETVRGTGPEAHDALQSLLDRMERRCAEIREELTRMRERRP